MDKVRKELEKTHVSCKVVFVVPDDVKTHYRSPQAVLNKDGTTRKKQGSDLTESNQYYTAITY